MHSEQLFPNFGQGAIFVTGAAGVVGQALIRRFPRQQFICLAHKKAIDAPNVVSIAGDVRQSDLGMPPETCREIASGISCIVHSAAITDFTAPGDEFASVNVNGTLRVLAFAEKVNVPLMHISTAYVLPRTQCKPSPYELSKITAEEAVRKSRVKATIVRPSIVVGDTTTGEIANFQGFHFLIGLFLKGLLPFVPAHPDSYIDFVPQDFLADVIMGLVRHGRFGEEVWLTAGPRALRIDDIVDCCLSQMPPLGAPLTRPNMISQDTYERLFRPVFFHALPKGQKKLMDRAMTMVKYLNTLEALPCDSPGLAGSLRISQMADPREILCTSMLYWVRQHRAPSTSVKRAQWATG